MARILVVDDEESIRDTFQAFLTHDGHEVLVAEGLSEALACLDAVAANEAPALDLVYLDIFLEGESGLDVLKHAQAVQSTALYLIITGGPSIDSATEAFRLGVFDYIAKPISREPLLHSARVALKHKTLLDDSKLLAKEKDELQAHMEAIFQSVSSALITFDQEMRVVRANQATEVVLRCAPENLVGQPCATALGTRSESFCQVVRQALQLVPVREFRVALPAGERPAQTVVLDCSPLQGPDGSHLGAVLSVRDITRLAGLERVANERQSYRKLVGKSEQMVALYDLIDDLAKTDTSVLISGQSGTGKELVAEALHMGGPRASKQLVKVNCSALSENLLESELFGHIRGAFTGAVRDKIGRFKLAHQGTIFLDEIGDISPRIQLNLLRVLQEKEFERVGDTQTIKVDVRVIAATNVDLREKVRVGEFREDLYYRLKVVELQMPALRDRLSDIPLLLEHFKAMFERQLEKRIHTISEEAQALLMQYPWPGNVRELKHAMEHAFILCRGDRIEPQHLPQEIREMHLLAPAQPSGPRSVDRHTLEDALKEAGGNKAKAARILGISRQTIYRKLEEYQLSD